MPALLGADRREGNSQAPFQYLRQPDDEEKRSYIILNLNRD